MARVPDFQQTHQWVRELRRWGRGRLVAVDFRIASDEMVYVGRFGVQKVHGPAGEVLPELLAQPWGGEVLLPRPVDAAEILRVRDIRQDVGWVETPGTAHPYSCVCPMCLPAGMPKLWSRCRSIYLKGVERMHASSGDEVVVLAEFGRMDLALERGGRRLSAKRLLSFVDHASPAVRAALADALGYFKRGEVEAVLLRLLDDLDPDVVTVAIRRLVRVGCAREVYRQVGEADHVRLRQLIEVLEWTPTDLAEDLLGRLAEHADAGIAAAARASLDA